MCIKTIFHNTYSDGQFDITERVESCTPGYMCANPHVVQYNRDYGCSRQQAKASQAKTDRVPGSPSPRSVSPSSPGSSRAGTSGSGVGSDAAARRTKIRMQDIYVNGTKIATTSSSTAPRPIPIKRAATMTYGGMEPPPERGRRPIIVEERVPSRAAFANQAGAASPVPVEVLEYSSSPRRRRSLRHDPTILQGVRRSSSRRREEGGLAPSAMPAGGDDFLSPHRLPRHGADRSPQGYGSAEDEQDRTERRRRRRAARERASVMPSSLPAFGNTDVFGSSLESSAGVSSASPRFASASTSASSSPSASPAASATAASASPAVSAVKKELRWEDEMRRRQNERINMRPKLSRSQTVTDTNAKLHGEVKSILKNGNGTASGAATPAEGRSPRRSPQPSPREARPSGSRRSSFVGPSPTTAAGYASDVEDVFTSFAGLGINDRRAPVDAADESPAAAAERNRLRNRFSMPPRRFTAGSAFKRRTEIWYPDEGRYRFM